MLFLPSLLPNSFYLKVSHGIGGRFIGGGAPFDKKLSLYYSNIRSMGAKITISTPPHPLVFVCGNFKIQHCAWPMIAMNLLEEKMTILKVTFS